MQRVVNRLNRGQIGLIDADSRHINQPVLETEIFAIKLLGFAAQIEPAGVRDRCAAKCGQIGNLLEWAIARNGESGSGQFSVTTKIAVKNLP